MPDEIVAPQVAEVVPPVAAPVVPPVEVSPIVAPVAAPQVTGAELDAALKVMEAQLAANLAGDFRVKELDHGRKQSFVNGIAVTEENKGQVGLAKQQVDLERQQLELEKSQLQHQLNTQLPEAIRQYKEGLLQLNREHNVPISLLATAQTQEQLSVIVAEWVKAHPKTEVKEAVSVVAVVAGGQAVAPPAPAQAQSGVAASGLDSGLAIGGAVDEPWRGMSAKEKILFGMGIRK